MLRGLLYRKLFAALETVLGVTIAGIVVVILIETVTGAVPPPVRPIPPPSPTEGLRPSTRPISDYAILTDSGLFGSAASFNRDVVALPPEAVKSATKLPLTLKGTTFTSLLDPSATAVIEVREGQKKVGTFFKGEEIVSQVILREIRSMEVILENRRKTPPTLERLTREEAKGPVARPVVKSSRVVTARRQGTILRFSRDDSVKKFSDNMAALQSKLDVEVSRDSKGNVQGVTATNLSEYPELKELAEEFGFQEGDILASVNGEPIDSQEKVYEIAEKYSDQLTFRITIIRGGKRIKLVYRFE